MEFVIVALAVLVPVASIIGWFTGRTFGQQKLREDFTREKILRESSERQLHERELNAQKLEELTKKISESIIANNADKLNNTAMSSVNGILTPFKDKIAEFQKEIRDNREKQQTESIDLKNEIKRLTELNQKVTEQTNNLTTALSQDSKLRGNWGEIILERLLEESGLQKDREYKIQKKYAKEEGDAKNLQPDIVVYLPEGKNIVIDSKVSMTAWVNYCSVKDANEAEPFLKQHTASIETHIKSLFEKEYSKIYEINSPDFVFMFIPIEAAFIEAMRYKESLYNEAYKKNVILISPTTLMATLRIINNIWKQERQNQNTLAIAEQGGKIYDKLVGFLEDFEKIGEQLSRSSISFEEARKKLSSGRGNVIDQAEKMKDLGLSVKKQIPSSLIAEKDEK